MLRPLTGLFRRRGAPEQLALPLDAAHHAAPPAPPAPAAPATAEALLARLRGLGLAGIDRCRLTRNRTVMVSFRGRELRVHEGYLAAPEPVLRAIVAFVCGRTRAERRAGQRAILGFPIDRSGGRPPARRRHERMHPDDEPIARRLAEWHARYNARHFGGRLKAIPVTVSRRMKTRLGHYCAATPAGDPAEIVIGRRHVRRHGWEEALHTLLHEMVHQWQDETGHAIDHGRTFRAKAREVGVTPSARRAVVPRRQGEPAAPARTLGFQAARTE